MNFINKMKQYIPTMEIKISGDQTVSVRQYSMLEYKGFLAAKNGENVNVAKEMVKFVDACVTSEHDVSKISYFDFQHIFLELYCISSGKVDLALKYQCGTKRDGRLIEGTGCGHETPFRVNVNMLKPQIAEALKYEKHGMVFQFRYPTFMEVANEHQQELVFADCLTSIGFPDGEIVLIKDLTEEEQREALKAIDIELMKEVIIDLYKLDMKISLPMKCIKCQKASIIELEAYDVFLD